MSSPVKAELRLEDSLSVVQRPTHQDSRIRLRGFPFPLHQLVTSAFFPPECLSLRTSLCPLASLNMPVAMGLKRRRSAFFLKEIGSEKECFSGSSMAVGFPKPSCSRTQNEDLANQAVDETTSRTRLKRPQRPQEREKGAPQPEQRKKQRDFRIPAAEISSSAERKRTHVAAAGQQTARGMLCYVRTAVRNRKRRWRLLAQRTVLAGVFKTAPQSREAGILHGEPDLLQRHTNSCVPEDEESRGLCTDARKCVECRSKGSSCICPLRSPAVTKTSSAASISSAGERRARLACPFSLRQLHEFSPPALQSAATRYRQCSSATTGGAANGASSVCPVAAAAADVQPAAVTRETSPQTASNASLILNPPSFAALGITPALFRVAATLHIERPSPIQVLTLPRALRGGDLCGVAPTGTGKTLCYCWPLLQRIACGNGHAFLGLVLLPARELAVQVLEQFRIYGASLGTRTCVLLGGRDLTEEGSTLLHQAPHIVIATPGRLADNVQNNFATMRKRLSVVEVLVLDEADMLLSDEFKEDLKYILACLPPSSAAVCSSSLSAEIARGEHPAHMEATPRETEQTSLHQATEDQDVLKTDGMGQRVSCASDSDSASAYSRTIAGRNWIPPGAVPRLRRQTLLFSATVSPALLALQQQRFGDALMPLFDATAATAAAAAAHTHTEAHRDAGTQEVSTQQQVLLPRLSHYYLFVPTAMRFLYLLYLLEHVPPYNRDRGIIFAGSVRQTQRLCTALEVLQQQVTSLHSIMKQRTLIACLEKFRSEVARLLICTDVAGRGLDLPRVEFVICLDVPSSPQVYVHRTGRTARAGRKGVALTFVEPPAVRAVHRIEAYIDTQLQPLPSFKEHEVLQHLNHYSRVLQKAALFLNEIGFDERAEQHEAYTKAFKELRRSKKDATPLLL